MTDKVKTEETAASDPYAPLKVVYSDLQARRKALDDECDPLQKKLDTLNAEIEERRAQAHAIALQMSEIRGGMAYIDLCKQIGTLAKSLSGQLKS